MKKFKFILVTGAVLLFASSLGYGQERENFRIGISGYPLNAASMFENGSLFGTKDYYDFYYNNSIKNIYEDIEGKTYSTGTITLEYGFRMNGGFEVSLNAGFDVIWKIMKSAYTDERKSSEKGVATYLIPMFKFFFVEKESLRMYTGAGLGFTYYCGFEEVDFPVFPSAQWTPFGFEAGKDIFLFGELGLGTMFNGGRIGLGFRF